jgi:transposase
MAYRELHMIEVKEVLRLWKSGFGLRAIARRTGVDRKTVRRYVDAGVKAGLSKGPGDRAVDDSVLASVVVDVQPGGSTEVGEMREECRVHRDLLLGWVEEGCKGPKLVKLLARHTGVHVPLRTLQRYVAEELTEADRGTVRIVDGPPGELEADFLLLGTFVEEGTGDVRKMHALLCTATYSRHQFLWPCLGETQEDLIDGLEGAWRFFGGVFPVLITDNPKVIVDVPDPVAPKLNLAFVEYMQSRDFVVDPARVRTPTDKARVERQVQYARNDFFLGERFRSVEEARAEAVRWCLDDAGMRTHGRTRRAPREVFEQEERSVLRPPPQEVYDRPRWTTHHVGRDHAVVVDYALYSVPYKLGECELQIRSDRSTVKLYYKRNLVKIHPRRPEGGNSLDPLDMPPEKRALATRDGTSLVADAVGHGAHVGEYARRLMEGPLPWSRMRHVYRLLGLVERYGPALVDEACGRALELDVVEVIRVDRMLQKGLVARATPPATAPPAKPEDADRPLRFARNPAEFRTGVPDAA